MLVLCVAIVLIPSSNITSPSLPIPPSANRRLCVALLGTSEDNIISDPISPFDDSCIVTSKARLRRRWKMADGKKKPARERERESNFLWWKTNGWNAGLNEQKRIPFFHLLVGVILLPGPGRPVAWLDFNLSFYPPTTRHNGCHDSVQCGGWCFEQQSRQSFWGWSMRWVWFGIIQAIYSW